MDRRDAAPPTPDAAIAALDCGMQLAMVLELLEAGHYPSATSRIHKLLDTAYDALMDLAPEAGHGPISDETDPTEDGG